MRSVNLYAFTLLRNAIKYDYCYHESLQSLLDIVKEVSIALGEGEDDTVKEILSLAKTHPLLITPTYWDETLKSGAIILSQQTNIALDALRKKYVDDKSAWAIYLQADEVIPEWCYKILKKDIAQAEKEGCDALSFRYLHFWQDHYHVAINKKWYPQEIRAIKLHAPIESWGDAQSFKGYKKVFVSDAYIFHYGHVRRPDLYQAKKKDMLTLYHENSRLSKYQKKEKKFDDKTKCLSYFGPHPIIMKKRILELEGERLRNMSPSLHFVIINDLFNQEGIRESGDHYFSVMNSSDWKKNKKKLFKKYPKLQKIYLRPSWWQRLRTQDKIPEKMESKLARSWDDKTLIQLKISQYFER